MIPDSIDIYVYGFFAIILIVIFFLTIKPFTMWVTGNKEIIELLRSIDKKTK